MQKVKKQNEKTTLILKEEHKIQTHFQSKPVFQDRWSYIIIYLSVCCLEKQKVYPENVRMFVLSY